MTSLIKGNTAILALIKQIHANGKALDDEIQLAAMSVINHVELHGDTTVVNTLYLAMPKGARKAALSAWLLTHGKLIANKGKGSDLQPFGYNREGKTDLEGGAAKPWYTFKLDKAPSEVFNLLDGIAALIKRAESAAAKGLAIEGGEQLAALRNLAPKV